MDSHNFHEIAMRVLRGKTALVTGAASGIGRAIALALAREGVDLFLLDRNVSGLEATAAQLREHKVECHLLVCDLVYPDQISQAVRRLLQQAGKLDILVNNAGVAFYGSTERMTAEQWDWLLQINLHAPIQLVRELMPTLLAQPEAHILNVCSIAGLVAGRNLAAYHTSKFGLVGFSEALRAEFSYRGLGVTALCPGLVRTSLFQTLSTANPDKPFRTPPNWLCISPETVARQAIKAIRRNRGLVLVSPMAHFLWFIKRWLPGLLDWCHNLKRKKLVKGTCEVAAKPDDVQKAA